METTTTAPETIRVQSIRLERAEGLIFECGKPYTTTSDTPWTEANTWLLKESMTAPTHGGYNKTDFILHLSDGNTYSGRYDLKHHTIEIPSLTEHVRKFITFSSGTCRPPHMSEESYRGYLAESEKYSPGITEQFRELLENFQIGD